MPTPSPTMLPRTGAKVGISVIPASTVIVETPTVSPKTAMPIGSAAAASEPNARNRIATAARRPGSSPAPPPGSGQTPSLGLQPRERGARRALVEERRPAVGGGDAPRGGHPLLAGAGPLDQLGGLPRVQSRSGHRARGPPAEGDRGDDRERGGEQPRRDHPPRMPGGAPAQTGEGFREH